MTGTTWADLFQVVIYGDGAIIGLALVAIIGIFAIAKARAAGVIFVPVAALMCLQVIANAGNDFAIFAGIGYALLIPVFALMSFSKGSTF